MPGRPASIEVVFPPAKISFEEAAWRLAKATEILMKADRRLQEHDPLPRTKNDDTDT
jgi:hypothetical protein